ncbi:MAG: PAC2 family protein [Streptosporangiaceae bacterium]|nr:PAC2 family protein [Streptosporangiaceae bacterium]
MEFGDIGELSSPVAIAGFEGWNDAGEAASGVLNHLGIAWQASPIAAIDPEDYYDFQVNRPVIEIEGGRTHRLIWPTTRISLARGMPPGPSGPPGAAGPATGLSRDVVLVHGIEPNMRWRAFSEELVGGLESLGVGLVILLGALLADAPHTRPVPVSVGSSNMKLTADAAARGAGRVDYKGPTGILGVVQHACVAAGMQAVSLWAQVPHYVAQPPSPKATLALLRGVEDILDAPLPLADLPAEARAWERGVDELAAADAEVADYVRTLEEAKDALELPEASGDAIAREFERYFRRHGGADPAGG